MRPHAMRGKIVPNDMRDGMSDWVRCIHVPAHHPVDREKFKM